MGELKLGQFDPSVHVQRHLVKLISQMMLLMIKLVMLMIIVSSQFYPSVHVQRQVDQSVDDGDVDHDNNHVYEVSPRGLKEWR